MQKLTLKEAATYYGVSITTIRNRMLAKQLRKAGKRNGVQLIAVNGAPVVKTKEIIRKVPVVESTNGHSMKVELSGELLEAIHAFQGALAKAPKPIREVVIRGSDVVLTA